MKRGLAIGALLFLLFPAAPSFAQREGDCEPQDDLSVVSVNNEFDAECLAVDFGQAFQIDLRNDDRFAHNLSIYETSAASEDLFVGEYVRGNESITYDVDELEPGRFYFRCDIHPTMNGRFLSYDENGDLPESDPEATDPPEDRAPAGLDVNLEPVATGLTAPVFITHAPSDDERLFVVDQAGQVRIIRDGELVDEPFLDVSDKLVEFTPEYDERGLLGLAFHPDYAENGRFIAYYSAPLRDGAPDGWNHTGTFSEFRVSDDPDVADPDSERVILRVDKPQANHNGGHIAFGPDGHLYIPMGDGGMGNDEGPGHVEGGNAQSTDTVLGKVLRIDVDGDEPYGIPEDNPFADGDGEDEIFALGFRNPYHLSFDSGGDNEMWVADAGQDRFEEASIVQRGGNYGWRIKEGTHCFDPENPSSPPDECPDEDERGDPIVDPVIEYSREEILGSVIVGGYVYRGDAVPELQGQYVFGDYSRDRTRPRGVLFAAERGDPLWHIRELQPVVDGERSDDGSVGRFVLSFGEDANRELYVGLIEEGGPTGQTGAVYRLTGGRGGSEAGGEESNSPLLLIGMGVLTVIALGLGISLFRVRRRRAA